MENKEILSFLADYIYKNTGIIYSEKNFYRLEPRLKQIMEHFGYKNHQELRDAYSGVVGTEKHEYLVNLGTNNETFFMRDEKPFFTLSEFILPRVMKHNLTSNVSIWSCGCSSGQEPYSILMTLDSKFGQVLMDRISLDATDISTEVLAKAQKGEYEALEVHRGLPEHFLNKYFIKLEERSMVKPTLKAKVRFNLFNITKSIFPISKYDVIFCRNVLIYQDLENRKKILQRLYDALKPHGVLVMGRGETTMGMDLKYIQEKMGDYFVYIRE